MRAWFDLPPAARPITPWRRVQGERDFGWGGKHASPLAWLSTKHCPQCGDRPCGRSIARSLSSCPIVITYGHDMHAYRTRPRKRQIIVRYGQPDYPTAKRTSRAPLPRKRNSN
jgi:hypothetical protein